MDEGANSKGLPALGLRQQKVLYEEAVSVWCYPDAGIICHQMHAVCRGQSLKLAFEAGLRAMIEHGAHAWLSDDRANGPMSPEDEHWARADWFPRATAAGWKHWAMVMPLAAVGKLNVRRLVRENKERGLEAQMFDDPSPALEWLLSLRRP